MDFMLCSTMGQYLLDDEKKQLLRKKEATEKYVLEPKKNGTGLIFQKTLSGECHIWNRPRPNRVSIDYYPIGHMPEHNKVVEKFSPGTTVQGESICLKDGRDWRWANQKRCAKKKLDSTWREFVRLYPARYDAYDVPKLHGEDLSRLPLTERKQRLTTLAEELDSPDFVVVPHFTENFVGRFESEDEGVVIKLKNSKYIQMAPGAIRLELWTKCKHAIVKLGTVIGFTRGGTGRRAKTFRSLVLADENGRYIGKVGGGLDDKEVKQFHQLFSSVPQKTTFMRYDHGEKSFVYVEAKINVKMMAMASELTDAGVMREPKPMKQKDKKLIFFSNSLFLGENAKV